MKTLVTGDFIKDFHIINGHRRHTSSSAKERGTMKLDLVGGAGLTFSLLKGMLQSDFRALENKIKGMEVGTPLKEVESEKARLELIDLLKKRMEGIRENITEPNLRANFDEELFKGFIANHPEFTSFIEWEAIEDKSQPRKKGAKGNKLIPKPLGYGSHSNGEVTQVPFLTACNDPIDLLIIDEANLGFRHTGFSTGIGRIVMKMAYPFCEGLLWDSIQKDRPDLTLIVTLENLRRYDIKVSKAISWEQTALDLCFEITRNEKLKELLKCTRLVILIGSAGALCVKPHKKLDYSSFELVFDPDYMEDEWEKIYGTTIGSGSTFLAGFCRNYMIDFHDWMKRPPRDGKPFEPDLVNLVRKGLNHIRLVNDLGLLCMDGLDHEYPFPLDELVQADSDNPHFYSQAFVPSPYLSNLASKVKKGDPNLEYLKNKDWTILENNYFIDPVDPVLKPKTSDSQPFYSLAREVAYFGPGMAKNVPMIRFGKFVSLDRSEIESIRNIKQLVLNYHSNAKALNPLNIAVFGPPGSGKSFSVKQMAKAIFPSEKVSFLEYNLSQFTDPDQFIGAYHAIRDAVLAGKLPFVFWDEFDSENLKWLKELIAPMQDGKFMENGVIHPLGKCVFIMAGGTSYTMDSFDPERQFAEIKTPKNGKKLSDDDLEIVSLVRDFKMKKGPDFVSRIHGYLNVQGPNRRQKFDRNSRKWVDDVNDVCFPVRRALFIRTVLGLEDGDELRMDWDLVSALLELKKYLKGARSLERILGQLTLRSKSEIVRSDLPSDEIITMNVDYTDFMRKLLTDRSKEEFAGRVAVILHNDWVKKNVRESTFYTEYRTLSYNGRQSNIAAAARIFKIVGSTKRFSIVPGIHSEDDAGSEFDRYLEEGDILKDLAIIEHDEWMKESAHNGWQKNPENKNERNDYLRFHRCMVSYDELNEEDKIKDRDTVLSYTRYLKDSGFVVSKLFVKK